MDKNATMDRIEEYMEVAEQESHFRIRECSHNMSGEQTCGEELLLLESMNSIFFQHIHGFYEMQHRKLYYPSFSQLLEAIKIFKLMRILFSDCSCIDHYISQSCRSSCEKKWCKLLLYSWDRARYSARVLNQVHLKIEAPGVSSHGKIAEIETELHYWLEFPLKDRKAEELEEQAETFFFSSYLLISEHINTFGCKKQNREFFRQEKDYIKGFAQYLS